MQLSVYLDDRCLTCFNLSFLIRIDDFSLIDLRGKVHAYIYKPVNAMGFFTVENVVHDGRWSKRKHNLL